MNTDFTSLSHGTVPSVSETKTQAAHRLPRNILGTWFERKFGWIIRYPLNFTLQLYLKIKNRRLNTPEGYAKHQREFFAVTFPGDESDKFDAVRKKIARSAMDGQCVRALDVATGYGFQAIALRRLGVPSVVGIDLVRERIEHCKRIFPDEGVEFRVMDAKQIEFADGYFDATTISAALHDLPNSVKRQVLCEICRVTRNRVVIFEPRTFTNRFKAALYGAIGSLLDESISSRDYVQENLPAVLHECGLEVLSTEHVCFGMMTITVCRPQQQLLAQRSHADSGTFVNRQDEAAVKQDEQAGKDQTIEGLCAGVGSQSEDAPSATRWIGRLLESSEGRSSFILLLSTLLAVLHRSFGSVEFIRSVYPLLSDQFASYYFFATCFILFGLIPYSVVRFIFREPPEGFGLQVGDAQFGALMIVLLVPLVSGAVLFPGSQLPEMRSWYPLDRGAASSAGAFVQYEIFRGLLFYTAWEFMFRGFMLFGLRRHVGDWVAICIQTISSCLWHLGMPLGETLMSIPGGVLFGYLALKTRSILWPFLLHWFIGIGLDLFIVLTS